MGTRSLTYVYEENNGIVSPDPIVCMYRQFDGYPTGHGKGLAEFLLSGRLVNGLSGIGRELQFNGMNCLAAQIVAHFKVGAGGIYLYPTKLGSDYWQEYEYHVFEDKVVIYTDYNAGKILFSGTWKEFDVYCSKERYDESDDLDDALELVFGETLTNGFELNDESVSKLKDELRSGAVMVAFKKSDGTDRLMKCTLSENLIPISTETTKAVVKKREPNPDVLAVWDIESDGWRSFRWDSVISTKVL